MDHVAFQEWPPLNSTIVLSRWMRLRRYTSGIRHAKFATELSQVREEFGVAGEQIAYLAVTATPVGIARWRISTLILNGIDSTSLLASSLLQAGASQRRVMQQRRCSGSLRAKRGLLEQRRFFVASTLFREG